MRNEEFLNETLADEIKSENPRTQAARDAKKMGLIYGGFGRYLDSKGNVAYTVHDGKLVPFKGLEDVQKMYDKAVSATGNPEKTKQLRTQADTQSAVLKSRQALDQKILRSKNRDAVRMNDKLNRVYGNMLQDDTIEAIQAYTSDAYESVNRFLYKGHDDGTDSQTEQNILNIVNALDTAFDGMSAPFDYSVYTGLSNRYKAEKIVPGAQYLFRGYLSASLDPNVAVSGFEETQGQVILQIDITEGQKALHIDGVSSMPDEMETLLPRGTLLQIVSGPHPLDATLLDPNTKGKISLFHCAVVEEE